MRDWELMFSNCITITNKLRAPSKMRKKPNNIRKMSKG